MAEDELDRDAGGAGVCEEGAQPIPIEELNVARVVVGLAGHRGDDEALRDAQHLGGRALGVGQVLEDLQDRDDVEGVARSI